MVIMACEYGVQRSRGWPKYVRIIRSYRLRTGLSQRSFALLVGVSQAAVGRWETGAAAPSVDHCREIAGVAAAWTTDNPAMQSSVADALAGDLIDAIVDNSLMYRRRAKAWARLICEGDSNAATA